MAKVVIIGGGVIGLASAYYLRKKGFTVIVLEKGEVGDGCSRGNAGLITPALFQPLPHPGLVLTSIRWLLQKESPLYIKPTALPRLVGWLYQFWRHCTEEAYHQGSAASFLLSRDCLTLFDELEADGVSMEKYRRNFLYLFLRETDLKETKRELEMIESYGLNGPEIVTPEQAREIAGGDFLSEQIVGGLYLPGQRHLRPESFTQGLHQWLMNNGVEIKPHSAVTEIVATGGKVDQIKCGSQSFEADYYIMAAGIWTGMLARQVGFHLPLTAGKGYSITLTNPSFIPYLPLHLGDLKMGVIPYQDAVRIVGTMELSGINEKIDPVRVNNLRKAIPQYFNQPLTGENEFIWTGMRPMTPDGVPVVGQVPGMNNLYMATGHAMSGIYMSLSTGCYLTQLISSGKTEDDLSALSPARFLKS